MYMGKRRDGIVRVLAWGRNRTNKFGSARPEDANFRSLFNDMSNVYQAWCRRRMYRRIRKWSKRGHVVIVDRYPLREFWMMPEPMDGPRLLAKDNWLARLERGLYNGIGMPDRVLVLQAPLEVLRKRKGDLDKKMHAEKARATNSLGQTPIIKLVDGSRDYPEVLLAAKKLVWEAI